MKIERFTVINIDPRWTRESARERSESYIEQMFEAYKYFVQCLSMILGRVIEL